MESDRGHELVPAGHTDLLDAAVDLSRPGGHPSHLRVVPLAVLGVEAGELSCPIEVLEDQLPQ